MKRLAYYKVKEEMDNYVIPIIVGHRRVGKTTILMQLIEEYPDALLINFEAYNFRTMSEKEVLEFFKYEVSKGTKIFLIDEVQQMANWDMVLKELFDTYMYSKQIKIVATGSSSLNFENKESGVDRTTRILMGTLTYDEYLAISNESKSFETFESFLTYGAFPGYVTQGIKSIDVLLNKTLNMILNVDIPTFYGVKSGQLEKVLNVLIHLTNGEFNKEKTSKDIGFKNETIERYISILEQCQIIKRVYRVNENFSTGKYPKYKVYINPHFHLWLLGQEFRNLDNKYKGHIIEAYWLFSNSHINGYFYKYYYFKNAQNEEIDFVSRDRTVKNGFRHLIEFKYDEKATSMMFPLLNKIPSVNKIVFCKENAKVNSIEFKSILDFGENDKISFT